ncbi:MAG: hypothetical protein K6G30_13420, partial [Acetatifactor sp.]|nr:hypothetical protein [Acetatifactor sp.]
MPVMDEFKEERERIKSAPFSEKLKYFWSYYKFHTLGAIAAIILGSVLIHDITSQKDTIFFAAILNSVDMTEQSAEDFKEYFLTFSGLDTEQGSVLIDSTLTIEETPTSELSMAAAQRMMVYTSTGELDAIVGGSDVFGQYAV